MIIINASSVKIGKSGGSETLATNFINNLHCTYSSKFLVIGHYVYLDSLRISKKNIIKVHLDNFILRRVYVEYILLPFLVIKYSPIKVINFSNTCSPLISKGRNILILLDANYRYHSGMHYIKRFFLKSYIKIISNFSNTLVTISQSAANDLNKDLKRELSVAYLGGSFDSISSSVKEKEHFKPFVLALSSLSSNKNISWLVANWNKNLPKLILVGHGSRNYSGENVEGFGYASIEDLYSLFLKCSAFVFPSVYEGFGIPIVDCMNLKKPIVLSDIPVFKEVAGDYGFYFRLGSSESLELAVKKAINNKELLIPPRKYSWFKFTNEIINMTTIK